MSVSIALHVGDQALDVALDDDALAAIAAALPTQRTEPSPFLTVVEAAEFLRCKRQRIDDLLSQRRLTRHKDGRRTLVSKAELEQLVTEGRR